MGRVLLASAMRCDTGHVRTGTPHASQDRYRRAWPVVRDHALAGPPGAVAAAVCAGSSLTCPAWRPPVARCRRNSAIQRLRRKGVTCSRCVAGWRSPVSSDPPQRHAGDGAEPVGAADPVGHHRPARHFAASLNLPALPHCLLPHACLALPALGLDADRWCVVKGKCWPKLERAVTVMCVVATASATPGLRTIPTSLIRFGNYSLARTRRYPASQGWSIMPWLRPSHRPTAGDSNFTDIGCPVRTRGHGSIQEPTLTIHSPAPGSLGSASALHLGFVQSRCHRGWRRRVAPEARLIRPSHENRP